jgi:uncharacterized protein YjbJ (UPF0337 family)
MAGTNMKWEGRWDQLKGKIKQVWADVTDDDLGRAEGDYDRTIGILKEKTGETVEDIESKLDDSYRRSDV